MEMLCPECMGVLQTQDGQDARCPNCGKRQRILFAAAPVAAPGAPRPPAPAVEPGKMMTACTHCGQRFKVGAQHAGTKVVCTGCNTEFTVAPAQPAAVESQACVNHPSKRADLLCVRCGAPICATCAFPRRDGSQWCPACVRAPKPSETAAVAGRRCVAHPNVPAVRCCKACGAPMCATCDFELPGGVHVCPQCATSPRRAGLSGKRKAHLVWSYVLAVWSTIGVVALFSGALAGAVQTEEELQVLGIVIYLLIFVPSLIGTALGFAAFDRRLGTPTAVWVAAIWNSIILAGLMLLTIIGTVT